MGHGPSNTPVVATLSEGEIHLRFPYDAALVSAVKRIPGSRWDPLRGVWRLRGSDEVRRTLERELGITAAPPENPPAKPDAGGVLMRLEEEMRLRGYSPRTRKVYTGHIRRFLEWGGGTIGERPSEDARRCD